MKRWQQSRIQSMCWELNESKVLNKKTRHIEHSIAYKILLPHVESQHEFSNHYKALPKIVHETTKTYKLYMLHSYLIFTGN